MVGSRSDGPVPPGDAAAASDPSVRRAGSMTLGAHLSELRTRLSRAVIAIVAMTGVAWAFYPRLFDIIKAPIEGVVFEAQAQGLDVRLVLTGVTDPFLLQLQVSAVAGLILATPVWSYQVWRFIAPGLHRHERTWAYAFAAMAAPLFIAGALTAYYVMPFGLALLFGFTPEGVGNYVPVNRYLAFFLRLILVFGFGYLTPVLLLLLNAAGIVSGRALARWWRIILLSVLAFAAIATPTGDPFNMLLLAGPMLLIIFTAVGLAVLNDRRRDRRRAAEEEADPLPA